MMEQGWPQLVGLLLLPWLLMHGVAAISRHDFPPGFLFGAASSAYQVEGAAAEDGRKPSIWDAFTHAGRISDKSTGDIAADQYHKYKEDVKLMHEMGVNAYRFSFSWSRLIPDGRGSVNPKGLQYYNNLIDELLNNGIDPHVTLHHFDRPQSLEDEYGGLLNRTFVGDFTAYADVCFKEFGDRVKYWTTFNEANIEPIVGYELGAFPPGRCSSPYGNCSEGDSETEPYIAAHNILLAHASAASLYKEKYQAEQGGYVGINILGFWFEPFTNSTENVAAAHRMLDLMVGWTMDPLVHGSYPAIMRQIVGPRLPSFSTEESKKLIASLDFLGVNHYAVAYVLAAPFDLDKKVRDYYTDVSIKFPTLSRELGKVFLLQESPSTNATPWGLQKILEYIKVNYGNPPVLIHENGYAEYNIDITTNERDYDDELRANYVREYIEGLLPSIRNGTNTRGYFVWSFIDCYELFHGYTSRFGLYGVDFNGKNRTRYPRYSAHWYSGFLKGSGLESRTSGDSYLE